jgi:hypothetical protein
VSVTGGTGSSATFNITFSIGNAFTITAAGSGYIEQPTVTFSGGGGSCAAAYATVGSSVRLQSLGTTSELAFAFRGASGINSPTAPDILRILDVAAVNDTGIFIQNSGFGRAQIQAYGNANANLFLCANGSGRVTFTTSGTSLVEQMRVAHTASAVNYVQVTGSATATQPVISAQGSDASVGLRLQWKGQANMFFVSGAGAYTQFRLLGANNAVNNLAVSGTVAGSAPILSAEGSDTNIDLALTPKGTGGVAINSAIKLGAGLDAGTSGYVMTSAGTGASPTWTASTAGGMTLLGTITTTSGTSVSLSSLVLTSYKQVLCVFSVSNSGTTGNFTMTDPNTTTFTLAGWPGNAAQTVTGSLTIDLSSGVVFGAAKNNTSTTLPDVNSAGNAIVGKTTFSTATTSLTFGASAGAFDAGSILVYGIK